MKTPGNTHGSKGIGVWTEPRREKALRTRQGDWQSGYQMREKRMLAEEQRYQWLIGLDVIIEVPTFEVRTRN
jgi:hypothetical protein